MAGKGAGFARARPCNRAGNRQRGRTQRHREVGNGERESMLRGFKAGTLKLRVRATPVRAFLVFQLVFTLAVANISSADASQALAATRVWPAAEYTRITLESATPIKY